MPLIGKAIAERYRAFIFTKIHIMHSAPLQLHRQYCRRSIYCDNISTQFVDQQNDTQPQKYIPDHHTAPKISGYLFSEVAKLTLCFVCHWAVLLRKSPSRTHMLLISTPSDNLQWRSPFKAANRTEYPSLLPEKGLTENASPPYQKQLPSAR